MGLVKGTTFKTADSVDRVGINEFSDNLELFTIDDQNTASNWATSQHFTATPDINEVWSDGTSISWSTSSNTWTDISNVSLGSFPAQSGRTMLLRVQWNGLAGELIGPDDIGADNLYALRVKVQTASGAAYYRAFSINTFTGRTWNPISNFLSPDPINWRPLAGSGILLIPPGIGITSITVQGIVKSTNNTLVVDRMHLVAILSRA